MNISLTCPACRHYTFQEVDNREVCHSCGWKNELRAVEDPDWADGENQMSLNEYKKRLLEWMLL